MGGFLLTLSCIYFVQMIRFRIELLSIKGDTLQSKLYKYIKNVSLTHIYINK
jgi:hypothetical protein